MKLLFMRFWLIHGSALLLLFSSQPTVAQITPDATLPINSRVTQQNNVNLIEGGTTAATNLFHSFETFSIPTGGVAFFNNALNIQNIISRVTGKSSSNIDGTIRALGTANLFLINPNGIVFSQNAKLDIGGSFLASTANAIEFGNQGFFSASNPEAPLPLLTINPSALFFNSFATAPIQVNSAAPSGLAPSSTLTANGLRVPDGQNLSLVGGDININGGGLFAFGGRVELGGFRSAGTVNLNGNGSNLSLSFPDGVGRSDVSLTNNATVNVRGQDAGSIAINAQNLNLANQSRILAGIASGLGSVKSIAGNIDINAQAAVNVQNESRIDNSVQPNAIGQSGDININTGSLSLGNDGDLNASTAGIGNAGNITINAKDTVSVDGVGITTASAVSSDAEATAVGKAGNISITTGSLSLTNGGVILSFSGSGDGGNITVNARDTVSFDGLGFNAKGETSRSGLFSSIVAPEAVGNGGDISITTNSLTVKNGARLSASTFGRGNAGNININARDAVLFDGVDTTQLIPRPSGAFSTVYQTAVGNGGDINITTNALTVRNNAQLNASSLRQGSAGDIKVDSNFIRLDNQARILATTTSGNGGNINLGIQDFLLLRRGSQISTNAGTAEAGGNGGNININAPLGFLLAVKNENSDISANAYEGSGGKVQIQAFGIFNIEQRRREDLIRRIGKDDPRELNAQNLQSNDITAISQENAALSGQVNIITPYIDPSSGLVELPDDVSDRSNLIAQGCPANQGNKFTIVGRGGLPPLPTEAVRSNQTATVNWVTLDLGTRGGEGKRERGGNFQLRTHHNSQLDTQMMPATGWVINNKGEVTLIASASQNHINDFLSTACPNQAAVSQDKS
ncbi:filamentous hemagglutinin outer membrane protein [Tolypothrix sp. NIES-4075]|uniref:two-partner secretion domain-containing protein n=1 Tax=Tolypothrix sp. NIES-4075 TaxID=2005459 RepID=UPI000B74494E|nr:filamentous hemagglutinin N-terminal domain-containing protein [Tolypothrix sp. NIES-4075]GAX41125.1 filamentous hemagglutinin outer membrane protein [Tolypothrix sp. NIES-4075]